MKKKKKKKGTNQKGTNQIHHQPRGKKIIFQIELLELLLFLLPANLPNSQTLEPQDSCQISFGIYLLNFCDAELVVSSQVCSAQGSPFIFHFFQRQVHWMFNSSSILLSSSLHFSFSGLRWCLFGIAQLELLLLWTGYWSEKGGQESLGETCSSQSCQCQAAYWQWRQGARGGLGQANLP